MKKRIKWIAGLLALVIIVGGAYFLYDRLGNMYTADRLSTDIPLKKQAEKEKANEAFAAPDFTVVDGEEKEVKLSDMKGKPVVINFWASWCPPCKAELPDFEKIYKEFGDDVAFMIVNMTDGKQETVELAKAHIEENAYTFPVYYDTMLSAATAYRVSSIPTTYFADEDGNLITYAQGMIDYETIKKGIGMIQ